MKVNEGCSLTSCSWDMLHAAGIQVLCQVRGKGLRTPTLIPQSHYDQRAGNPLGLMDTHLLLYAGFIHVICQTLAIQIDTFSKRCFNLPLTFRLHT